jgi:peptidoglycan/xylan/chitin deacetylase (PgdA/CDA1 family)
VPLPAIHPSARRRAASHPVTVLVWHDLVPREKLVWFDTTTAEFDSQLNRLARAGAHPISLAALYRYLSTGAPVPPPGAVVLCFDDNTRGILDYAAPRLQKRGWPFAVSAHTAYIGITTGKAHSSWAQLQQMERMGATIVSQTHTHPPDLRTLTDDALLKEMTESKRRMEETLGHTVPYVTYPSGKWDARVARAAQTAGYQMALTEDHGASEKSPHLLGVQRWTIHKRFDQALAAIARAAKP